MINASKGECHYLIKDLYKEKKSTIFNCVTYVYLAFTAAQFPSTRMIVFVLALLAIREAAASYSCNVPSNEIGMRLHETTSPTAYDCLDSSCRNTCRGGQCVALITCRCYGAPGTNCWSPGAKVVNVRLHNLLRIVFSFEENLT